MTPTGITIYTIGHSTRSAEAFVDLLRAHAIEQVADVRTVPRSRRHPQFDGVTLEALLRDRGFRYRQFAELGGLRHPRPDSTNTAWRNPGFRGYADYMQTPGFARGVDELLQFAAGGPTAVMCAEAVWWRCHRALLADALVVQNVVVRHILSAAIPQVHTLADFARVEDGRVTYPGLV